MLNFFKKAEGQQGRQVEEVVEEEKNEEMPKSLETQVPEAENLPEPISPEQVFAQSIQDVKEYLEVNGKIDPETIEIITGMSLEETLERLEKDENLKMELSVNELKQAVIDALKTLEEPARENWFKKAVNKPAVKGIFVALMLFLKFSPDAQGAEKKEIDQLDTHNRTEASFESNTDDANTYQLDSDDLEKMAQADKGDAKELSSEMLDLERYAQLDISNYYQTDSDVISEDNKQEIASKFTKFLDNINANNFQEIVDTDFEIKSSSDPRETNRKGGNIKLAEDRGEALERVFRTVLASYDFGDRLSADQAEQIQNKEFKIQIPEGGVTHLVDLINPDTGENYTENEISALSEEERLELLKDCRRVDANFLAKKSAEIQEMTPKPFVLDNLRMDNLKNTLSNWNDYESITLIVDNSPSMNASYAKIAEIIKGQPELKDTEVKFGTFSDKLDGLKKIQNLDEVEDAIEKMDRKGSHQERAIQAALTAIQEMEVKMGEKAKLIIATDEPLQNLNSEDLQQLKTAADDANCEVDIIHAHNRQGGAAQILSLEELLSSYQEIAWQELSPVAKTMINSEEQKLNRLESTKNALEKLIDRTLSRDNLSRADKKNVEDQQARLNNFLEKISQSQVLLTSLEEGLAEGDLLKLESAIKENNGRYRNFKVDIDPSTKDIGVNLSLTQNQ
jgi:hypothetical protein